MKYILTLGVLLLTFCFGVDASAQKKELKKARQAYEELDYYIALENYKQAIEKGAVLGLEDRLIEGRCYYMMNDITKTYETFVELQDELKGEDVFIFASAQHQMTLYEDAIQWYEKSKLQHTSQSTMVINDLIEACKWAMNNDKMLNFRVNPCAELITQGQSFGVQYFNNKVVYSSAASEDSDERDQFGKPFLNLYCIDLDEDGQVIDGTQKVFSQNLLSPYHVGAISFTNDLQHMYYTKTINDDGDSRVQIFIADYNGSDWVNERVCKFINDKSDYAHPAVSPDDKYLYFVSNRPGGHGGKDIWYVEILGPNKYGKITNCGSAVNTYDDEVYPVINQDGNLYFSSRGHHGFGGLDIFSAELINGKWQNVRNILKPFNSERDDFCYVKMPGEPRRGFLSTNRWGAGDADVIFKVVDKALEPDPVQPAGEEEMLMFFDDEPATEPVVEPEPEPEPAPVVLETVKPYIFSADLLSTYNNERIPGATVIVKDANTGAELGRGTSDGEGHVILTFDGNLKSSNPNIVIEVSKDGFNPRTYESVFADLDELSREGLRLTPIFNDQVLDDISGMEITYGDDLDEDVKRMLDKLAAYLLQNSNIVVKVNAHTEAKGNRYGNLQVSQDMADKAVAYVVSKGVNKDQLIPRGYGERYLKNRCHRGVYCDKSQHAVNRRIEIVVWNVRH